MFGGPQPARLFVGERNGGLVVADALGQGERPGARAIVGLLFLRGRVCSIVHMRP
jgi:hypothetical protein